MNIPYRKWLTVRRPQMTKLLMMFFMSLLLSGHSNAQQVTSSSHDGNVPENTLDGQLSTRWSALGAGQWVQYDLGGSYIVDEVNIAFYKGAQRRTTIDIQVSSNGSSWQTLWSGLQPQKTDALQTFNVADTSARFVRVVGYGNDSGSLWTSLTEVDVVALGAPSSGGVTASSDDGNVPENTLDNNLGTRWSALGDGQWIQYDLGGQKVVDSVDIAFYKGDQRRTTVDIQISNNASSWQTLWSGKQPQSTLNLQRFDVTDSAARYVRIVGRGNDAGSMWNSITEVKINQAGGGTPPTPLPTVTPQPTPSPGCNYPSDVLDLTNWKITIPFDRNGNDGPTKKASEVKPPVINTYILPPYFTVNDDCSAVIFRAHAGGATTSGSGYPRSELRERTNGGTSDISWSSGSGKHTMRIRQRVTHLPVVKPHVVVGQIHDGNDDVIVVRLERKKLFVDINGDDGPIMTSNYELGTEFDVAFVVENNETKVYYNNSLVYTHRQSYSGAYFKAGMYTQSSCGGRKKVAGESCNAYGEVEITRLSTKHE